MATLEWSFKLFLTGFEKEERKVKRNIERKRD